MALSEYQMEHVQHNTQFLKKKRKKKKVKEQFILTALQ